MRTGLKILRVKNKLSQEQMANIAGITRQTYSAIETGAVQGSVAFWQNVQEKFAIENEHMWELMRND